MRSIILAAGKGTRLNKLTQEIPKCLVKIKGKSLIEYQLSIFNNFKFKDIILIAGYKYKKLKFLSKKIVLNKSYDRTNMLYSLYCALKYINGDVLISYGDSVFDKSIIKKIINSNSNICVASDANWKKYWKSRYKNPLLDLETFKVDQNNNVTSLGDKPKSFEEINGQYIGLIKLSSKGSEIFKKELEYYFKKGSVNNKNFNDAFLTDFLQVLISKGYEIKSESIYGNYIEIDTIQDIDSLITQERVKSFKKNI